MKNLDTSVPVLVLGGKENSLSLVRHLSSHGIRVSVSGPANCWGLYSRHAAKRFRIPRAVDPANYWSDLLLSGRHELDGHMVMPCSDHAITFIADNHAALAGRYVLDEGKPELRKALLDKQETLALARKAGVATPNSWSVAPGQDLSRMREEITFPVMVKPLHSHLFSQVFGRKLFIVEDGFDTLVKRVAEAHAHGLEVMVMEMIPGPDDLLSSYYTYMDAEGARYFDFTKRIVRRFPVNRGGACYHATEWLPETAEVGRKFFEGIGFAGLGNVEFKRDLRDGKLKLIEANARFTAAQELALRAGAPIDLIVYRHLTGQGAPMFREFRQELYFWYPISDFLAFVQLNGRGDLKFGEWVRSVAGTKRVDPLFSLSDPLPLLGAADAVLRKLVAGGWRA